MAYINILDVEELEFTGPRRCCDAISSYVRKNRDNAVILDVGAGTGLLGEEVRFKYPYFMYIEC